jgi:GT2 family glycosyltransferase
LESIERLKLVITVSVIIVSWNTKQLLRQCLNSLISNFESQISKLRTEIIVVDNASVDGSWEMVEQEFPQVKLIKNKSNLGFAKGNNLGAAEATGELLFFLNSDTVIKSGSIEKLALFLSQNSKLGAVSPLLLNNDETIQRDPAYLCPPSFGRAVFYYNRWLKNLVSYFWPDVLFSRINLKKATDVEQLSGAALMIRKKVFEKIGGFDEEFLFYFEDVDLCFRLRKAGYRLMVLPQTQIIHYGGESTKRVIQKEGEERRYFLNFASLFLFCEKHYAPIQTKLIQAVVLSYLILGRRLSLVGQLIKRR